MPPKFDKTRPQIFDGAANLFVHDVLLFSIALELSTWPELNVPGPLRHHRAVRHGVNQGRTFNNNRYVSIHSFLQSGRLRRARNKESAA
jgi:hypothetical protein